MMNRMQTNLLALLSAVLIIYTCADYSLAASPQKNNAEVRKGLLKLQEALSKQANRVLKVDNGTREEKNTLDSFTVAHNTPDGKPSFPVVVSKIEVFPDRVEIRYSGKIQYNVFKIGSIVALDIINQKNCGRVRVYKPQKPGMVSRVVVACHMGTHIYHYRFLRISIHTKGNAPYNIVEKHDLIVVNFKKGELQHGSPIKQLKQSSGGSVKSKNRIKYKKIISRKVIISLKDISRIYSPYPIKQVIYSREKHIQVQVLGNNVFIKILPTKILMPSGGYSYIYSKIPRDIYIVTGEKVYSLNLVPEEIPAVTYILPVAGVANKGQPCSSVFSQHQVNPVPMSADSYVDSLLSLIKSAYKGEVPDGYTQFPLNTVKHYRYLTVRGMYKLVGRWVVYAYTITAEVPLTLRDSQFLYLVKKPLASTVVKPILNKGESTMLFLIGGER